MSGSASSGSTAPQATPEQLMGLYNQALPSMLATTVNQAPAVAGVLAGSAAASNPIYTASGLQQLQQYAPGYANAGNLLSQEQALGQAGLLAGSGGLAAQLGAQLNSQLNPVQQASNAQAQNLLGSINLNGLSGGEQAAVERSLNQSNYATGNLGIDNATNAVSNAMNFGNALQAKRTALSQALGTAQGVSANQQTQVNPLGTAFGAGNTANNFGLGQFNPTQANANLTAPLSFGSSTGNQIAGVAGASRGTTGGTSGGCYLTSACCEYKGLTDNCEELETLRKFRDEYVPKFLVEEYYKYAPKIVDRLTDAQKEFIWSVVKDCVRDIKSGDKESALNRYTNMVEKLKGELR